MTCRTCACDIGAQTSPDYLGDSEMGISRVVDVAVLGFALRVRHQRVSVRLHVSVVLFNCVISPCVCIDALIYVVIGLSFCLSFLLSLPSFFSLARSLALSPDPCICVGRCTGVYV